MCYYSPWIPNVSQFHSRPAILGLQGILDKCTEWPQTDLQPYKVKGTGTQYMCYWSRRVPNFTHCVSLDDQQLSESQILLRFTLRPFRNVPHICVTNIPEYHFSPTPNPFPWSKMHLMTSEWPWTRNSKRYPVCIKYLLFVRVTLRPVVFEIKGGWKLKE